MITHLSASSISSYLSCPRQWAEKYLLKVDQPVGDAARLGQLIHQAMELSALSGKDPQEVYVEVAPAIGLLDSDLFNEGKELLTWLVSQIAPEKICRTSEGIPLVEYKFNLEFPGVEVPIIGYIDRIQLGISSLEIIDFKTGRFVKTNAELQQDPQTIFYYLAGKQLIEQLMLPTKEVSVTYLVPRLESCNEVFLTEEKVSQSLEFFLVTAKRIIEGCKIWDQHKEWHSDLDPFFPETTQDYCTSCTRRSSCNQYRNLMILQEGEPLPTEPSELASYYHRYRLIKDAAESQMQAARSALLELLSQGVNFQDTGYNVGVSYRSKTEYDARKLWELAPSRLRNSILEKLELSAKQYNALIKEYQEDVDAISVLNEIKRTIPQASSSLTVKKV